MITKTFLSRGFGMIFFLSFFLFANVLKAVNPPVVQWADHHNETYGSGSSAMDWMEDIISTSDGGSIGVGFTWTGSDGSYASGACDDPTIVPPPSSKCDQNNARTPSIVKYDYAGHWVATFKPGDEGGSCPYGFTQFAAWGVAEVNDGYVICAYMPFSSGGGWHYKVYVAKLNKADLTVITDNYINSSDAFDYLPYSLRKVYNGTYENGFIIAGYKSVSGSKFAYTLWLGNDLSTINAEYLDANSSTRFFSATALYSSGTNPDGTPISAGSVIGFAATGEIMNTDRDVYVVGLNAAGTASVWNTQITSYLSSGTMYYQPTVNGAGILCGACMGSALPDPTINCGSTSTSGFSPHNDIRTWHALNTSNDYSYYVSQLHDGNIIIAGEFDEYDAECADPSLNPYFCYSDEYKSDESFLIKIIPSGVSAGFPSAFINYNVGGGGDFREKFKEVDDGSWDIVAISNTTNSAIMADYMNDHAEIALFKINASLSSIIWTKTVKSVLSTSDDCSCAYGLDITADGGFIVGGNNGANGDDMIFVKFGNECENNHSYTAYSVFTPPSSSGTYSGSGATYYVSSQWALPSGSGTYWLSNYNFIFLDASLTTDFYDISTPVNFLVNQGTDLKLTDCTLEGAGTSGSCTSANDMWPGITVVGNSYLPQISTNQGTLELYGTTIRDAQIGVTLGTPGMTNGGGILIAAKDGSNNPTQFLNNRVGISFDALSGTSNVSTITDCLFDCTAPLTGYFGNGVDKHVSLSNVTMGSAVFLRNTFDNSGGVSAGYGCNSQGYGIYANNSDLQINDPGWVSYETHPNCGLVTPYFQNAYSNYFKNLDYGIFIEGTGYYLTPPQSIWLNQFQNVKQCITVDNSNSGPQIGLNYFYYSNVLPSYPVIYSLSPCPANNFGSYSGVRIQNCPSFNITNNRLSISSTISTQFYLINGIWVTHSGTSSSPVSSIYYNEFKNQSPLSASVVPTFGTTGVWSTGIRIDDADAIAKHIDIYENGEDNSSVGVLPTFNPNLANLYDWYLDDPGFTQTPSNISINNGVDNWFTAPGTINNKQIYSTHGFTYNYYTLPASPLNPDNTDCFGVSPSGSLPDLSPGNDYCMNVGDVMPSLFVKGRNQNVNGLGQPGQIVEGYNGNTDNGLALQIVPNPFQNSATIKYSIPSGFGNANMNITDGLGRHICNYVLNTDNTEMELDGAYLQPGIYYYKTVCQNGNQLSGKFVVAKP